MPTNGKAPTTTHIPILMLLPIMFGRRTVILSRSSLHESGFKQIYTPILIPGHTLTLSIVRNSIKNEESGFKLYVPGIEFSFTL